jgi:quercetin dioxygenase-like cupin family protein
MTTLERSSSTAERPLDQPAMTFDLPAILADLKREPTWRTSSRNAVTLLKQPGFRVVLVALQADAALAPHRTESAVSIHVLEGELAVDVGAERYALAAGRLLTLHPGLDHAVRASTASAFLLTLAGEALHPAEATPDAAAPR